MSHSVAVVLIPNDEAKNIIAYLERVLAPFDENTDVPEYDRECWCVGHIMRTTIRDQREAQWPIDTLRTTHHASCKANGWEVGSEEVQADWQARLTPGNQWEEEMHKKPEVIEGFKKPDPECEECEGRGTYRSDYNPQSKWDWYVVGGRWNGWIQGEDSNEGKDWKEFYAGLEDGSGTQLYNNVIKTETLKISAHKDPARVGFALLDLEGKWHQRGDMGWFGMIGDEKEGKSWHEEFVEILDKAGDCWAVAVDVHI